MSDHIRFEARPGVWSFVAGSSRPMPVLTLQQLRVVLQLAGGRSYKQTATALDIAVDTVRLHVCRVSARLDGDGTPKDKVLLYADRLIAAQPLDLLTRAKAA